VQWVSCQITLKIWHAEKVPFVGMATVIQSLPSKLCRVKTIVIVLLLKAMVHAPVLKEVEKVIAISLELEQIPQLAQVDKASISPSA